MPLASGGAGLEKNAPITLYRMPFSSAGWEKGVGWSKQVVGIMNGSEAVELFN